MRQSVPKSALLLAKSWFYLAYRVYYPKAPGGLAIAFQSKLE